MKRITRIKATYLIILIALLLTACQPTPSAVVVVNKGDNKLEEKIHQSPTAESKYDAPANWKEDIDFDTGNLSVYVDAVVQIPDTDTFPVVDVVGIKLTQDQADKALNSLIKGKPLYEEKTGETKQEIEKEILGIQEDIANPDSDLNEAKDTDPDGYKKLLKEQQSEIADLKEKLKTAPDTNVPKPASLKFQSGRDLLAAQGNLTDEVKSKITDWLVISGQADLGRSAPAQIGIGSSESRIQNGIDFYNVDKNSGLLKDIKDSTENLNGVTISKEQAIKTATDEIKSLGLDGYSLAAIGSDTIIDPNIIPYSNGPKCYVMYFTHSAGNIPVTFVSGYKHGSSKKSGTDDQYFRNPWPDEVLEVVVDNSGINTLLWNCPYKILDTVSANVSLMPFDRVKDTFKEQIKVQGIWDSDPEIINREIHIDKAVLGMAKIPKKDNPDVNMLVPAWDFFGYSVYKYKAPQPGGYVLDKNNEYKEDVFMHSFLTINAIDGSVIQRDQRFFAG